MCFHTVNNNVVLTRKLGLSNRNETTFGNTCSWRALDALVFCSVTIRGQAGGGVISIACILHGRMNLGTSLLEDNFLFSSYVSHEDLRLQSHLVTFLSGVDIPGLSPVRKFALAHQHVLWFTHREEERERDPVGSAGPGTLTFSLPSAL